VTSPRCDGAVSVMSPGCDLKRCAVPACLAGRVGARRSTWGQTTWRLGLHVHNYAFLARKALWSYHDRLRTVVWENAFVIQVTATAMRLLHVVLLLHAALWHTAVCADVCMAGCLLQLAWLLLS